MEFKNFLIEYHRTGVVDGWNVFEFNQLQELLGLVIYGIIRPFNMRSRGSMLYSSGEATA